MRNLLGNCQIIRVGIQDLQRELLKETQERVPNLQVPLQLVSALESDETAEDFISAEHEKLIRSESFQKLKLTREKAQVYL